MQHHGVKWLPQTRCLTVAPTVTERVSPLGAQRASCLWENGKAASSLVNRPQERAGELKTVVLRTVCRLYATDSASHIRTRVCFQMTSTWTLRICSPYSQFWTLLYCHSIAGSLQAKSHRLSVRDKGSSLREPLEVLLSCTLYCSSRKQLLQSLSSRPKASKRAVDACSQPAEGTLRKIWQRSRP